MGKSLKLILASALCMLVSTACGGNSKKEIAANEQTTTSVKTVMAKDGKESGYRGYVDGYTTDKFVKIRGVEKVHTNVMSKKIEHISIISDLIDETIIKAETTFF